MLHVVSVSMRVHTVCHKAAVDLVINIPSTSCELDKMLSSANEKQKVLNRKYLLNSTNYKIFVQTRIGTERKW